MIRSITCSAVAALVLSGCMFKVEHRLPENAWFGRAPETVTSTAVTPATNRPFERHGMKNWALAGLWPYTSWGAAELLAEPCSVSRVEHLAIETGFSWIDTIVWVVPGFAYGYYVWAPRTITVSGVEVEDPAATCPADPAPREARRTAGPQARR